MIAGHAEVDAARDVRQMALIRVAVNGTRDEAQDWAEARTATVGQGKGRHEMNRTDLAAAQRAALEAFGLRVET